MKNTLTARPSPAKQIICKQAISQQSNRGLPLLVLLGAIAVTTLAPSENLQARIHDDAAFEVSIGGGPSIPTSDFSSFHADTLGAKSGYQFGVSVGHFVTDLLSLGVGFNYSESKVVSGATPENLLHYRLYSGGVYAKYHFGYSKKVTPYVRLQANVSAPDFTTPLTTPGLSYRENSYDLSLGVVASLGARISTFEWGGIFVEAGYRYISTAGKGTSFKQIDYVIPADVSQIEISAGFSFDIGPKQ